MMVKIDFEINEWSQKFLFPLNFDNLKFERNQKPTHEILFIHFFILF